MAYGIDEIIEQKKNAYRGNPAALQQRSKVSKQLTDVLALEELTREVDARSRQMQMQIQQQPGTIAEQLQQKAIGQKQSEVLQGVSGVLANNQARRQQNMQRMASQGVAAQPRRNMQNMAQGGIVGFANGGQATFDKIAEIRKKVAAGELTAKEGQDQIDALTSRIGTRDPETGDMVPVKGALRRDAGLVGRALDALGVPTSAVADAEAAERQRVGRVTNRAADQKEITPLNVTGQEQILRTPAITDSPETTGAETEQETTTGDGTTAPEEETGPALDPNLGQVAIPGARTKYLSTPKGVKLTDATTFEQTQKGIQNLLDIDPDAERAARLKLKQQEIGMTPARIAAEKARQQELADLDARQLDPKKLQGERISAFLRGVSTSGRFAGGDANVANLRAQQELAERNRLLGRQLGERDFEGKEQEIKQKISDAADTAYDTASTNLRQGVSSSATLTNTEVNMLSDNARRIVETDIANMEAEDRSTKLRMDAMINNASQGVKVAVANLEASTAKERMRIETELRKLEIGETSLARADKTLTDLARYMAKTRTEIEKIYTDRIDALNVGGEDTEEARNALRAEQATLLSIALAPLRDRAKQIQERMAAVGAASGASGDFTVRQKSS